MKITDEQVERALKAWYGKYDDRDSMRAALEAAFPEPEQTPSSNIGLNSMMQGVTDQEWRSIALLQQQAEGAKKGPNPESPSNPNAGHGPHIMP